MRFNLILNSLESLAYDLSLSLLPLANEHLTIKFLCFSYKASKHLLGKTPAFSHSIGFKNICNFNPIFLLFIRFENPTFQKVLLTLIVYEMRPNHSFAPLPRS
jgi:hypothetical protein